MEKLSCFLVELYSTKIESKITCRTLQIVPNLNFAKLPLIASLSHFVPCGICLSCLALSQPGTPSQASESHE